MDGRSARWYFSTMCAARRPLGNEPVPITFHRTKYGRELLIDAALVSRLPGFDRTCRPHTLDFFDILLVTSGSGTFALDGARYPVRPGVVLFSCPGEVRRWDVRGLDGACLFFTADFLGEAFTDPQFIDKFEFLRHDRPTARLALDARQRRQFLAAFHEMEEEIASASPDASHALRALLYRTLIAFNRWYIARHGTSSTGVVPDVVTRFRALVEHDYAREHSLGAYSARLGLTPRQLNDRCRSALGTNAKAIVAGRVALEARRLLLYTELPAARVGHRIGFEDPAYFTRFFRRMTGETPTGFRSARR
jgi:AraC family transcriptional regulator, transcriptional activator of pobA